MESPVFTLPTIHLNGTGAADLEAQYRAVRLAISEATRLLGHAACNDRDFYPQGPGAYEKAVKERGQAFEHLSAAAEYVEAWEICADDALREKRCSATAPKAFPITPRKVIDHAANTTLSPPAMFDPNSITPSADVLTSWCTSEAGLILAARWGAAQAVKSLRYQWPEPIDHRPPTEADGNSGGLVQYLWCGRWNFAEWRYVADQRYDWLHTPNWRPRPEPTRKQKARALLDAVSFDSNPFTAEQVELLRQVVESAPEATP